MTPRLERALLEAIGALDELGLRYAVVGGLAVGIWAQPRATRDVDLYAELPLAERAALQAALERRGFDVPAMNEELQRFGVFRSKLRQERVFLDIFDSTGPLGASILERRKRVSTRSGDIWFVSAEDLAVLKAFSDRARDLDDLIALLTVPDPPLDVGYVEYWVRRLDESIGGNEVSERLASARRWVEQRTLRGGR
jgi:predicted nucleotidyltransferase